MEKNNNNTNVIAIVGFVLSFFIGIAGLICSIIGLIKSKKLKNGKGFSIAGIIISSLRILFTIALFVFAIIITVNEMGNNDLKKAIVGNWEPYRLEINGEERPLQEYYGSCIKYGGYITFYDNNTFENKVGCYSDADNKSIYTIDNDTIYLINGLNKTYINYINLEKGQSYIIINYDDIKIYFRKKLLNNEEKNIEQAKKILYDQFGEYDKETDRMYSYNYLGIYNNNNNKEFYVFNLQWLVNNDHLSSIGDYAVSLEDNDYYFINNSPDFLESGIIIIDTKVYED